MRPSITRAPFEFLFAFAIALTVIGTSFVVEPPTTRYVVLAVGVVLALSVAVAAVRPVRT